jgi:hypothetical protein
MGFVVIDLANDVSVNYMAAESELIALSTSRSSSARTNSTAHWRASASARSRF